MVKSRNHKFQVVYWKVNTPETENLSFVEGQQFKYSVNSSKSKIEALEEVVKYVQS